MSTSAAIPWLLLAVPAAAQAPGNGQPLNNGGDAIYVYSAPSVGATTGAALPDLGGDLYWRAHAGWNGMDDVDPALGAAIEVVGYHESLYDTDWSTPPSFYARALGPALPDAAGLGNLEPAFFQLGATSEVFVVLGPSGFGNPCSVQPSLCSGGACPPAGFVNGYEVQLEFGSTPGAGVVLPADGTAASDVAVTWFLPGGMTTTGGLCGAGDYTLQDVHSTDETQADPTGSGVNPWGGYQLAGGGPVAEPIHEMAEGHVHVRGNLVRVLADSGGPLGVEISDCGGGAANGRHLAVGNGGASLGVELSDNAATLGDLAWVGASLGALPSPGVAVLGGSLLVVPDALFAATANVWQGPLGPSASMTGLGLVLPGAQIAVPPTAAGAVLHLQGAVLDAAALTVDTTNRVAVGLLP